MKVEWSQKIPDYSGESGSKIVKEVKKTATQDAIDPETDRKNEHDASEQDERNKKLKFKDQSPADPEGADLKPRDGSINIVA